MMAGNTEEMRTRLKNALLNVIALAGDVNDCAISTENSIENSAQGRQAYENADGVKEQLQRLKEAGATTDEMATKAAITPFI